MSKSKYEFEYIMNIILWLYLTLWLPPTQLRDGAGRRGRMLKGYKSSYERVNKYYGDNNIVLVLVYIFSWYYNGGVAKYIINNNISFHRWCFCALWACFTFFRSFFPHSPMKSCYVFCRTHTWEISISNLLRLKLYIASISLITGFYNKKKFNCC